MILNVNSPKELKKHSSLTTSEGQIQGSNFFNSEFVLEKRDGFVTSSNTNFEAFIDTEENTIMLKYVGTNSGFQLNNRRIVGSILFNSENNGLLHKLTNQYTEGKIVEILFQWDSNTELNIANATGYHFSVSKILVTPQSAEDMVCVKCARFLLVSNSATTSTIQHISGDPLDVDTIELFEGGFQSSRTVKELGQDPTDTNIYWGSFNSSVIKTYSTNQSDTICGQALIRHFQNKGVNTISLGWGFSSSTNRTSVYFLCIGVKIRSDLLPSDVAIFSIKYLSSGFGEDTTQYGEIPVIEDEFLSNIYKIQSVTNTTSVNISSRTQNSKTIGSVSFGIDLTLVSFDETGILCRENFYQPKLVKPFSNLCSIDFVSGMNTVDVVSTTGIDMDTAFYKMGVKSTAISKPSSTRNILLSEARTSGSTMGFESHAPIIDDGSVTGLEFWAIDLLTISIQRANNVHYCTKFLKEHKVPYFFHKLEGGSARIWSLIALLTFYFERKITIKNFYDMFVQSNTKEDRKRTYKLLDAVYKDGCKILLKMQKSGLGFPELIQDEQCEDCKIKILEECEVCKGRVMKSDNIKIINNMIENYVQIWELKKLVK